MRNLPFNCTAGNAKIGQLVSVNDGSLGCAAFDSVTANGTAGPIYDTTHVYTGQTVSMKMVTDTGISCYVEYTTASIGSQTQLFTRVYLYLTANPTVSSLSISRAQGTTLNVASLVITTAGKIALVNAAGSVVATSTASVALNQWVRVEADFLAGDPATQTARLYNTADAAEGSPTETISVSTTGGSATITKWRCGPLTGVPTYTYWQTNIDINNVAQLGPYVAPSGGHTFYISRNGDDSTGDTYAHAWNELDKTDWAALAPGDTVIVDGGPTSCGRNYHDWANYATTRPGLQAGMVYLTELTVKNSGTAGNPITFKASTDAGHNGTVVQFGGRSSPLPEANQVSYTPLGFGNGQGINLNGISYVTIDGSRCSGWMSYGWGDNKALAVGHSEAIWMTDTTVGCIVRNVEVFDCGTYEVYNLPSTGNPVYKSDGAGVFPGGVNNLFDRCLFHDCGQDPMRSGRAMSGMSWTNCWSYYTRFHSVYLGYSFPAGCQGIADQNTQHVDGLQAYAGGLGQGPMNFDYCIFGPGLSQGIYLGDSGIPTSFSSVSITNTLILAPFRHGIQGDSVAGNLTPANWFIDHVTIHGPSTPFTGYVSGWLAIEVDGVGHRLTNSVMNNGAGFYRNASFTGACSGNVYFGGGDVFPGGSNVDPLFRRPLAANNVTATYNDYEALDLTPGAIGLFGVGSPLVSIQSLLDRIDTLNGTPPAPPAPIPYSDGSNTFRTRFHRNEFKRKWVT